MKFFFFLFRTRKKFFLSCLSSNKSNYQGFFFESTANTTQRLRNNFFLSCLSINKCNYCSFFRKDKTFVWMGPLQCLQNGTLSLSFSVYLIVYPFCFYSAQLPHSYLPTRIHFNSPVLKSMYTRLLVNNRIKTIWVPKSIDLLNLPEPSPVYYRSLVDWETGNKRPLCLSGKMQK